MAPASFWAIKDSWQRLGNNAVFLRISGYGFLAVISEIAERRVLVVHEAGLPDSETESINRQIRTVLGPLGFAVEVAADTGEASERLRRGNYALLIADVLHFATCTDAMAQVFDALREEPHRPVPGTLLLIRRGSDVTPAATYQRTNVMFMVSPFNTNELRAFVQRILERSDLPSMKARL